MRDKAFLSVLLYSFSRVSAVVGLKVRDYEHQRRRAYLTAVGLGGTPEAPLFQAFAGKPGRLTGHALSALRLVDAAAGLGDDLGCHSCRATGITNYSATLFPFNRSPRLSLGR